MEKLLIVGAGGFGRVVLENAENNYDCSFADDYVPTGSKIDGAEVIGTIADIQKFKEFKNLIVAIGDNNLRERVYERAATLDFSFPNIISNSAYISSRSSIGNGCIILNNVVIQSGVHAGNGIIINPGVELHNDCFVDSYSVIYTNSVIRSNAHVGRRAWIGSNVTIRTGETIEEDSIVTDNCIKTKKSFEELWGEVIATNMLPGMANVLMHKSFSNRTKDLLVNSKMSGREIADVLNKVISIINNGSIETIDRLVERHIKRRR